MLSMKSGQDDRNEAALGVIYSGEAEYTREENEDLAYVIPKEGTNIWRLLGHYQGLKAQRKMPPNGLISSAAVKSP